MQRFTKNYRVLQKINTDFTDLHKKQIKLYFTFECKKNRFTKKKIRANLCNLCFKKD